MDRPSKKQRFIESYIQSWYNLEPMTGDASFRKYDRIKTPITTYVLMDSPPEHYNTEPFEQIAIWLIDNNLSAPDACQVLRANELSGRAATCEKNCKEGRFHMS